MTQNQATQTISLEHIVARPTESKSTQTRTTRLSYKQLYEGQVSLNEGNDGCPDQSRNPEQITVLTWNIDGLDPEDIRERIPSLLLNLGKWVLFDYCIHSYFMQINELTSESSIESFAERSYKC